MKRCDMCLEKMSSPIKILTSDSIFQFCSEQCAEDFIKLATSCPDFERKAYAGRNYVLGNNTKH